MKGTPDAANAPAAKAAAQGPAARRYVSDLLCGESVDQVFLVRDKDLRTTKSGDLFVTMTLTDRTGKVPARMWQASEGIFNSIPVNGFIHAKGRTEDYRGALQFIVQALRPFPSDKVDLSDFTAVSELDIEAMWAELLEILRAVQNPHLRGLLKKFMEDRALVTAFKQAPAAMEMHHAFVGGLLEHTLNIARAAQALLPLYPRVNADLVLTAAFLHDVGKVAELAGGTSIHYTDRGQLIGHITMAAIWIEQKARVLSDELNEPFPPSILDLLQHIVLSHHGVHEYGSPKLPMIPEAFFLHYLDNLDAKMFMTVHLIANDPDADSTFTKYHNQLEARLYKGSGKLEGDA